MKKIIILLTMIVSPLIGQENPESPQIRFPKSPQIWSPKISIFSTIYGVSDFDGFTLPGISVGLDWMAGKKVYYYGKLQFNYSIGSAFARSLQSQLIGIGFYLLDTRKQDLSTGWSMVMNFSFGLGVNLDTPDSDEIRQDKDLLDILELMGTLSSMIGMLFYFPIDLSFYARYHINRASAFQFGINIAGHLGAHNRLLYGFTLGFAF